MNLLDPFAPEPERDDVGAPPSQCGYCGRFVSPKSVRVSGPNMVGEYDMHWHCTKCGDGHDS
jgi:hypothetical protein